MLQAIKRSILDKLAGYALGVYTLVHTEQRNYIFHCTPGEIDRKLTCSDGLGTER